MARQAGPIFITGTIDDVVFYQLGGKYYMRRKGEPTPITKKRMSQQEHYPVLYLRKQEFKRAAQMVREWYYTLPREVRRHGLFGQLTGRAVRWLRQGKTEEEIKMLGLQAALPKQKEPGTEKVNTPVENTAVKERLMQELSQWNITATGLINFGYTQKPVQMPPSPPPLSVLHDTDAPPG